MGAFSEQFLTGSSPSSGGQTTTGTTPVQPGNMFSSTFGVKSNWKPRQPAQVPEPTQIEAPQIEQPKPKNFLQKAGSWVGSKIKGIGSSISGSVKEAIRPDTSTLPEKYQGERNILQANPIKTLNELYNSELLNLLKDKRETLEIEQSRETPNVKKIQGTEKDIREIEEALDTPTNKISSAWKKVSTRTKKQNRDAIKEAGAGAVGVTANLLDGITAYLEDMSKDADKDVSIQVEAVRKAEMKHYGKYLTPEHKPYDEKEHKYLTRELSQNLKRYREDLRDPDPEFTDQLASGVGSIVPLFITAVLTKSPALVMGALEGLSEAGAVYEEKREQGKGIEESKTSFDRVFIANLILNPLLNKAGMFSDKAGVNKILSSAGSESLQEGYQQVISNIETDKPFLEGVQESMTVGGVIGGAFGGVDLMIEPTDTTVSTLEQDGQVDIETVKQKVAEGKTIGEIQQEIQSPDLTLYENALNSGDMKTVTELGKKYPNDNRFQIHKKIGLTETADTGDITVQSVMDLGIQTEVYRGTTEEGEVVDVTKANGLTGGESMTTDKAVAERFATNKGGEVQEYVIDPEARVVNHSDLEALVEDISDVKAKVAEVQKFLKENDVDVVRFDIPENAQGEAELRIINDRVLKRLDATVSEAGQVRKEYPDSTNNPLYTEMQEAENELSKYIKDNVSNKGYKSDSEIPKAILLKLNKLNTAWEAKVKQWESVYATKGSIDKGFTEATGLTGKQLEKAWDDFSGYKSDALTPNEKFEDWSRARLSIYKKASGDAKIKVNETTRKAKEPTKAKAKESKKRPTKKSQKVKSSDTLAFNPKDLRNPRSSKGKKAVDHVIKQSEIAKTLSEKLNVPIRRGKFNRRALGIYKPKSQTVRVKRGGLQTIFHEVGHHLDETIGFSKDINKTEREALMVEYGAKYEGNAKLQRQEAFAEFLRFRMTGQKAKATKLAPEFSKLFDEKIKQYPDVKDVIDTATRDFQRWIDQPAQAKVLSQISVGKQAQPGLGEKIGSTLHNIYTDAVDDIHPLSEFSKLAKKRLNGKVVAEQDPYVLARNFRGWTGTADLFLTKGTFDKNHVVTDAKGKVKMVFKGKSYSEILQRVVKENKLDEFRVYLVSRRVVEDLADRGIKTGIDVEDARTAYQELETQYPWFQQVAKERQQYKDQLMEYAHQNGLIGTEGLQKMKELNKHHVPFYRVMEEMPTKFLGKKRIAGNLESATKRIKGSEREIIDPFESDVKDTYTIINLAQRNNIGIAMANLAKQHPDLGRLFEEVDKPMRGFKTSVKEIENIIGTETGVDPETVITLFRPTMDRGNNMLNVNFGDQQKVFQVDPELFSAIQGMEVEDVGTVLKIVSFPAKILRAGATLSPDFAVRNPIRDQFTATIYSRYGFKPGIDLVKGMFEFMKAGDVYTIWKANGGEHSMFVSLDRDYLQHSFDEIMSSKGRKAVKYVKNPIELLRVISEVGEVGTRLGEARRALRNGASPTEAVYASRNVTLDFAKIGAKGRAVNMINAFFNAGIQGTDTMVRNFKNRPVQTLTKSTLYITLPSILLYFANRDDPRWKEIPQWQKNLFWIVMTEDHIYRIPKPFELGILFGSVPERILEVIDTEDPKKLDELQNAIVDGFAPGFIPTALIPIIENITNYSFFLERPVVPESQQDLPAEEQYGDFTSETAKVLGESLGYSPSKIDNLIYGYSGGLGRYSTQGMDKILEGTGIVNPPPAPAKSLEEMAVIKAFMVRKPVGSASESVNTVYELNAETTKYMNQFRRILKEQSEYEAREYAKDHPEIVYAPLLNATTSMFSDQNKVIRAIRRDRNMSPEEKRQKIEEIQTLQTKMASNVLSKMKEMENE